VRAQPEPNGARASGHLPPATSPQLSLFDLAPSPVVEYLRRLNINELTPLEAMNKLSELQRLLKE
jgi:DNA mismatch repair protein MutS